ncbi:hypothetical protein H0O00_03360 [Candidatus Micrarchaeota archaeon]|nr:hypothetical protein [Candidatus Micrarchaeota archaeon]
MKRLMVLLLLVPLAFAAWQSVAAMAMATSAILLAGIYIIGFGLSISELQILAKEEFFQLIALMVMIAALWGGDGILNSVSTNMAFAGDAGTMQNASVIILADWRANVSSALGGLAAMDQSISIEASKGGQCNIFGIGYSVSGCGGYSMLAAPLSMAGGIVGFAIAEIASMERLVQISMNYALNFILPLGILLRTFKMTRGAGGFMIALAVSMHIMLPAGIIFNSMLAETFLADQATLAEEGKTPEYPPVPAEATIMECTGMDTGVIGDSEGISTAVKTYGLAASVDTSTNEGKAVTSYLNMRNALRSYLYAMLIEATMGPILALLLMVASLRALTSIAGAEVDVSAVSRFI